MRGASRLKRVGGGVVVAVALAGATAGTASAMIGPACSARLVAGTQGSCSFDTPYDYANIAVEPVGTVTATIQCFIAWGGTYTTSRTVSSAATWRSWTPGSCSLTLTAASAGASAVGAATPATGPIIDPGPTP